MIKIILTLMITFGFAQAGQGYWDCTKSYGQCTYMKYDKKDKTFVQAHYVPKNERVYSLSPLAQHNATQSNTLAFNTVK